VLKGGDQALAYPKLTARGAGGSGTAGLLLVQGLR